MKRIAFLLCLACGTLLAPGLAFPADPQPSLTEILEDVSGTPPEGASTHAIPGTAVAQPSGVAASQVEVASPASSPSGSPRAGGRLWRLFSQFRWAVLGSVTAGLLCSLMGTLMLCRRMMLLGIALPQAASAGITLLILIVQLVRNLTLGAGQSPFLEEQTLARIAPLGSLGAVLLVLGLLAWTERRSVFTEAQWATVYVASAALVVLFLVMNPYGEAHMSTILEGNVITVTQTQFWILAGVAFVVGALMTMFRRELLLISFDPEMAWSLRLRLPRWNVILYVLLGVTVSTTVMIAGPMFAFGYLLLPPFAARPWARGMRGFFRLSIAIGVGTSLLGCLVSFGANWPLGPSQVMVATAVLLISRLLLLFRHRVAGSETYQERPLVETA